MLEAQPWASYRKDSRVSENARINFELITLRPGAFPNYLSSAEVGFESVRAVTPPPPLSSSSKKSSKASVKKAASNPKTFLVFRKAG